MFTSHLPYTYHAVMHTSCSLLVARDAKTLSQLLMPKHALTWIKRRRSLCTMMVPRVNTIRYADTCARYQHPNPSHTVPRLFSNRPVLHMNAALQRPLYCPVPNARISQQLPHIPPPPSGAPMARSLHPSPHAQSPPVSAHTTRAPQPLARKSRNVCHLTFKRISILRSCTLGTLSRRLP